LSNADLDRARGWLAMGTVASALMIVAGLVVATRTKGWQTLTSPWTIYALSRNPKIGDPTELHTEIIVNFDRALETNAPKLERAERAYLGVVALVGLNFVIWLIIAWIVVRPVTGT
jgi:hypothetical protein